MTRTEARERLKEWTVACCVCAVILFPLGLMVEGVVGYTAWAATYTIFSLLMARGMRQYR